MGGKVQGGEAADTPSSEAVPRGERVLRALPPAWVCSHYAEVLNIHSSVIGIQAQSSKHHTACRPPADTRRAPGSGQPRPSQKQTKPRRGSPPRAHRRHPLLKISSQVWKDKCPWKSESLTPSIHGTKKTLVFLVNTLEHAFPARRG